MVEVKDQIENEIKKQLDGMTDIPISFMAASTVEGKGTTSSDEESDEFVDRRAVRIEISNDDSGSEWAYENDVSVSNNIQRLKNTLNNGFIVVIPDELKENERVQAEKAKKLLEDKILELEIQKKTDPMITNRTMYSFGILHKRRNVKGDIISLLELDCHENRCFPIYNSRTGDLGGDIGKGLNPKNKDMEVALIQKGKINKYDSHGNLTTEDSYFYFSRDEIIPWSMNDRGKFRTVSPVKRILRLVEIKKSLENAVELIVRRFGPQIWIIVGNKDYNLSNSRVPESYMRDGSGNPVTLEVARNNYRTTLFNNIQKSVQKWSDGENLMQIAEYGVEPKIFTPSANVFQYNRYIDQFADYIKVGIFGLDVAGRVDVTSATMQDRLFRDLKDRARRERAILENIYQMELWNPILTANEFKENIVFVKFKTLDKIELTEEAETERRRSLAVLQYTKAGFKIPDNIAKKWNLTDLILPIKPELPESSNPPGLKDQPPVKKEAEK